ncbi:MAG: hypothetical protein C4527_13730 [Candidatus Omnitrophota bacterium]|jgi:nitrate/nitrite-specific signal transduction histidine kinase|nr:MAG: hypothetical protein C4527_13730 [Candidatus Omnitrophota bacterium]
MTKATSQTTNAPPTEVDDYTAKMDRMVSSLKRKSDTERKKGMHQALIWAAIGVVAIIASIFLMMNLSSSSFDSFGSFMSSR